ncbi:pyridoxamine 5'-phosphate oxidase family protein [Nocardioides zhouii]|uniref:Pyridoxamine 5'-phosphate oxidase family protein n=1 Tax=Nocardioides zhouii TaxID=1168729 RepID=A0A4Q2T5L3_9ACTN|nr:pyridoxamine 5'-phosphate oxidase family protein [Nocardioides zhouii]RYC13381.1 pyridoxamine 5'-phosphate oxidase family protein [Nocardioides zhouii]
MTTSDVNNDRTFAKLDTDECWRLVGVHGVGRIVFTGDTYTRVVPTIYDAVGGTAYFRAPVFGELARRADGNCVSLNVDNLEHSDLTGWSVQMSGTAHRVQDAATVAWLWSFGRPQTWYPGRQTQWIALEVDQVRGQRVRD